MQKNKAFDCLKMKDEAQQQRARELAGLSEEELLAYYQRLDDALRREQEELRKHGDHEVAAGQRR